MKILVTGGAGFIGRWVVKKLLDKKIDVWVIDDLSNGRKENIEEFKGNPHFKDFIEGSVTDKNLISDIFKNKFDICIHGAAVIEVQDSIDNPARALDVNVNGTSYILEEARKHRTKVVLVSTCMIYDLADSKGAINENHATKPLSPYAASKLAAEEMAIAYYNSYKLPVVVLRPFNVYGPFQKSNMEGGVVSIFIEKNLKNEKLNVFGDGSQTRDLLYVEDCADFVVKASFSEKAIGEIINAGTGEDIAIKELAFLISNDKNKIEFVPHHHPQAEIKKLLCDYSKAKKILGWEPKISLKEGLKKTEEWLRNKIK